MRKNDKLMHDWLIYWFGSFFKVDFSLILGYHCGSFENPCDFFMDVMGDPVGMLDGEFYIKNLLHTQKFVLKIIIRRFEKWSRWRCITLAFTRS